MVDTHRLDCLGGLSAAIRDQQPQSNCVHQQIPYRELSGVSFGVLSNLDRQIRVTEEDPMVDTATGLCACGDLHGLWDDCCHHQYGF